MTMKLLWENDKAYITRKNLSMMLSITTQRIVAYEKMDNPLLRADIGEKTISYDLLYALAWNANEIDHKHRPQADDFTGVAGDDDDYKSGDTITSKNAKKAKELEEAKLKLIDREISDIKLKEATGEYIRADDVDKSMVELAVVLLSSWRNLLETLPPLLVKKTQSEARAVLDDEFSAEVKILSKKVNK